MPELGKFLIVSGACIALLGVGLLVAGKIPWLGRLPGDVNMQGKNYSFHFPIVTCVLLSLILTILLNLFMRNR